MKPILIVGSYLSPYVRKVLACLEIKGIAYEIDHIVPFFGDDPTAPARAGSRSSPTRAWATSSSGAGSTRSASAAFAKLARIEDAVLRVPVAQQRDALRALGAPVSRETDATSAPRRGIMPI